MINVYVSIYYNTAGKFDGGSRGDKFYVSFFDLDVKDHELNRTAMQPKGWMRCTLTRVLLRALNRLKL